LQAFERWTRSTLRAWIEGVVKQTFVYTNATFVVKRVYFKPQIAQVIAQGVKVQQLIHWRAFVKDGAPAAFPPAPEGEQGLAAFRMLAFDGAMPRVEARHLAVDAIQDPVFGADAVGPAELAAFAASVEASADRNAAVEPASAPEWSARGDGFGGG
jgi:hypothetical protein